MTIQTTCPICHTIFRVTELSLTGSKGMVQCGVCGMVFDAHQNAVADPEKPSETDLTSVDLIAQDLSLQDHSTDSLDLVNLEVDNSSTENTQPTESLGLERAKTEVIPLVHMPTEADLSDEITEESRVSSDHIADAIQFKPRPNKRHIILWLSSATLLVFILIVQLLFLNRDHLAANYSWSIPLLNKLCTIANCKVSLPKDISSIKITHSSFEADPNDSKVIIVNIGLENDSDVANAFPDIALSLTNDEDMIVTKKNFKPQWYLPISSSKNTGLRPHTEVNVKLILEVDDTSVSGYKLTTFYSY